MLHIWDTRGFSPSRHLVVPSGRDKPPAGIGQEKQPTPLWQNSLLRLAGLALQVAVLGLRLSLQAAPSWAQDKGELKFI
ncbi:hypothetical protein AAFF_G00409700 [Aldrovandia affinis]|uniref:Uncharacterized protein n=1 Tax=Aldrovandia affinis TaxID=143900 RepID=A0AAD7SBN5_9TELE|nr:hypothetical protein AAFF_G00409700 [Aldrovandia affinis]